jgi:hypothetical protein
MESNCEPKVSINIKYKESEDGPLIDCGEFDITKLLEEK